jgi:uncharacterized membrane protein YhfC
MGAIQGYRIDQNASGEDTIFTFQVDQAMLDAGSQISVQGAGNIEKGWLRIALMDPDNQEAWSGGEFGGEYSFNTYIQPEKIGAYRWIARWTGETAGSFDLAYQALGLTALALLPGAGMVLVALAFVIFAFRRNRSVPARAKVGYLALGALAWVVTVLIKFAVAIPLNPIVYNAIGSADALWSPGNLLLYVYIGSLTGFTEVLLTWLLLRYTRLGRAPWGKALAFGIGFGAIEALLLGVSNLASVATAISAPQYFNAEALAGLAALNNPVYGLAPVVERLATICVHILCCLLLFYGAATRQARWMWVSFAFKTALDSVAAFAQFWGVETVSKLWSIEAVILVFGLISVWGIRWLRRRYPSQETVSPAQNPDPVMV